MNYATYDDLILRYPSAAKWATTPSYVSSGLIHFAERQVEGALASCFTVPFEAAHPTIVDLVLDVAYFRGMLTRDPKTAEAVKKMVEQRIKDIKEGREYILTGSGTQMYAAPSGGTGIWSNTSGYHPTHSMLDAESAFTMISSERLYAEEDERS